ncbi:MAG TPA: dihydrolipoyl dehydrogenase [Candidatus Cloacimonetes bacterium]|nr:dihydrolipoyl dehydrogenase [Candidatus Cloacimonadota bacterium]HEX37391.1 dihydrolipoyl dehydrogenase [Candidatus Cloacimonadota bacterium]
MEKYTVGIIGGGPGGYTAAIRLQQYGIDTVVFEKERIGGVCLNWGCIPTKALVKVSDLYDELHHVEQFGLSIENPTYDYSKIFKRKNQVVEKLVSGLEFLFKKRQIPVINEQVISLEKGENSYLIRTGNESYETHYVIIATGSQPKELPSCRIDGEHILSSKDVLKIESLPDRLIVVGGGVIGCEFASIFSQLGVEVHIVEFLPQLVSTEDSEISKRLAMVFKKKGIKLHLNTGLEKWKYENNEIKVILSTGVELTTDRILLSVGRKPNFDITCNNFELYKEKEAIAIDGIMETNQHNLFAIGDVTGKMLLAHTASKQGLFAAEVIQQRIKGSKASPDTILYENIPRCTFTNPEIGSVGLSEVQAKERFGDILVGRFPFTANGKALGLGVTIGFVKTIADAMTKTIVGMHILGPQATELIAEGGIIVQSGMTIDEALKVVYAHPTLSEAVAESIEDLEKMSIHSM